MVDTPFTSSRLGSITGGKKITISVLGDSFGFKAVIPALKFCCAKYYAADISLDERTYANGGQMLSVSGTLTSQLPTQTAQFAVRPTDLAIIYSGRNNSLTTQANVDSAYNDIVTAVAACKAATAGAIQVWVHGQAPRGPAGGVPAYYLELNVRLAAYAAVTPGVVYIDSTSVFIDPAQTSTTTMLWYGGTAGTFGSGTPDDLHPSRPATEKLAALYERPLRMLARQRVPRARMISGVTFDETNYPNTYLTGDGGGMDGLLGQLDTVVTGTVPGATNSIWKVTTGASGMVIVVTKSTGSDGYPRMAIALSGTLSADSILDVSITPGTTLTSQPARLFDMEAMVEFLGVTGMYDRYLVTPNTLASPFAVASDAHKSPDSYNSGPLFMYNTYALDLPSGTNNRFRLQCYFRAGSVLAGNIYLSRVSVAQVS